MKYAHLDNLIEAYLNQDYAYYADTVEGVIDAFMKDASSEQVQLVRVDIANFLRDHESTLDQAFQTSYGFDFNPKTWGLTAETFLKNLDRQLAAADSPPPS